jgi:predicted anti-sigma-YlaC factor YlaD
MGQAASFWTQSLVAAALLGATLGGMLSVGTFFWEHRDMSPCASVGLLDDSLSDSTRRSVGLLPVTTWKWSAFGAAAATVLTLVSLGRAARRLRRMAGGGEPDS